LQGYPWQAHYTDALPALNGLRMHYLDVPPDSGVPASGHTYLCLHGDSDWSYAFRQEIPAWTRAGHRVIAPDLIGFGKSDKPKKEAFHTLDFHRRVLLELVEYLGLGNLVLAMPDRGAIGGLTPPPEAQHRFSGLQIQTTAAEGVESSHAYDAPFPDRGHRAALRAFANLRASKEI
jgi:tRNA(adenine34) deaminase